MQGSLLTLPHCKGGLLANSLSYARHERFHFRWIPHGLDTNQKAETVTLSYGILLVLQSFHSTNFQSVITGDESGFFLYYPRDLMCESSRDEVPERVKQRFDTEKCLILLLWSVNGIHNLVNVLKASTCNSAFFCNTVVPSLFDGIALHSRRKSLNCLYIHLDNACLHNTRRSTECLQAKRSSGYRTRLTARTSHEVTSSSLVTSSENSPNTKSLTGRA
jgi:hypothetical protein